jgi:hypothetical protein
MLGLALEFHMDITSALSPRFFAAKLLDEASAPPLWRGRHIAMRQNPDGSGLHLKVPRSTESFIAGL